MNEGGSSKNIFQLENSDLSELKLLAKKIAWRIFYEE